MSETVETLYDQNVDSHEESRPSGGEDGIPPSNDPEPQSTDAESPCAYPEQSSADTEPLNADPAPPSVVTGQQEEEMQVDSMQVQPGT